MPIQTTSTGLEVLSSIEGGTHTTSAGIEVLSSSEGGNRVTALGLEVLVSPQTRGTRVTAIGMEVLVSLSAPPVEVPVTAEDPAGDTPDPEPPLIASPLYTPSQARDAGGQRTRLFWLLDDSEQSVELGGVVLRLRTTYRARLGAWYLDVRAEDGTPIVLGRRMQAQRDPLFGLRPVATLPDGVLIVSGSDRYAREDLGTALHLTFYPAAGLEQLADDDDSAPVSVDVG